VLEPKLKLPDPFDGTRTQYRAFVNQCRLIWTLHATRYPDDLTHVGLVLSLLTGTAAQWASPYMEDLDNITSLGAFMADMASTFDDPDRSRTAANAIRNLRQGRRSCAAYTSDFRRLIVDLNWNEGACIDAYRQGLSDEVKDRLSYTIDAPDTLAAYSDLAIRLDQRCHERAMERLR